jgi:hypothetical protein
MNEALKNVFDKEYSKNKLTDFFIKTQKLFEVFDYGFILKDKNINKQWVKLYGGKVILNEDYRNFPISDLEIIHIKSLYPKILLKIVETNLVNFNEVYGKLLSIYENNSENDSEYIKNIKDYINLTYGVLQNEKSLIYSNNIHLVSNRANVMLSKIYEEFKGHIVYIDTDDIYFRNFDEVKERFEKYFNNVNKYDLMYFTEKSSFGYFSAKKKYLIEENSVIKIKGMKHFNKDGSNCGGLIKIFKNNND